MGQHTRRFGMTGSVAFLSLMLAACVLEDEGIVEGEDELDEDYELDDSFTTTANLIKNASFEGPIVSWGNWPPTGNWGSNSATRSSTAPHSGSYKLLVPAFAGAAQCARITAGKTYVVTAWVKHHRGADGQIMNVTVYGRPAYTLRDKLIRAGTSTLWHKISTSFYAPTGSYEACVEIADWSDPGGYDGVDHASYSPPDPDPESASWDDISLRGYDE